MSQPYHRQAASEYEVRDVNSFPSTQLESSIGDRLNLYSTSDFDANAGNHAIRQHSFNHSMMYERNASLKENAHSVGAYHLDLTEVVHSTPFDLLSRYSVSKATGLQPDFEFEDCRKDRRKAVSLLQPSEVARYTDGMAISYPRHFQLQESTIQSSEPPLFSEIESMSHHSTSQSSFSFDSSNHHLRMYSSPISSSESGHGDIFLPNACSLYPHSSLTFHHVDSMPFNDDPLMIPSREEIEQSPIHSSHSPCFKPKQERSHHPLPPEGLNRKLPYACRDFRNGQCTRGEKCRFMHVCDVPTNNDTLHQHNTQICRDFLRGQCQRKNCKYLHTYPESVDSSYFAPVQELKEPILQSRSSRHSSSDCLNGDEFNPIHRSRDDSIYSNRYPKEEYPRNGRDFRHSLFNADYQHQNFHSEYRYPPMKSIHRSFANGSEELMEPGGYERNDCSVPGHRRKVDWNVKKDYMPSDSDV